MSLAFHSDQQDIDSLVESLESDLRTLDDLDKEFQVRVEITED